MNAACKKISAVLILVLIVLCFVNVTLKDFEKEKLSMANIIGEKVTGKQITLNEYIMLSENTIGIYISAGRSGDTAKMYSLLTPQYRDLISYEDYTSSVKNIDFSRAYISNIDILAEKLYLAEVVYNAEESQEYLIVIEEEGFGLVPEKFLEYNNVEEKIKKRNVTYTLMGYEVRLDKCIFDIKIKNENKDEIIISQARMIDNYGRDTAVAVNEKIGPSEEKIISIPIATELDFPEIFEITRETEKKYMNYSFELNKK